MTGGPTWRKWRDAAWRVFLPLLAAAAFAALLVWMLWLGVAVR